MALASTTRQLAISSWMVTIRLQSSHARSFRKTECPFCGNVWQEHTLNQVDPCMAKLKRDTTEALVLSAASQSEASLSPSKVEICPVCSRPYRAHTEADLSSCVANFPFLERGASGLELQSEFIEAHFKDEEPDPVKRAQLQAKLYKLSAYAGRCWRTNVGGEEDVSLLFQILNSPWLLKCAPLPICLSASRRDPKKQPDG